MAEAMSSEEFARRFNEVVPMTDAALAEIETHNGEYGLGDATDIIGKLLTEAKRARARLAEACRALTVGAELIDRLAEVDECDYDRNDCCQSHHVNPRPCPHPLGRQYVEAWRAVEAEQLPEGGDRG